MPDDDRLAAPPTRTIAGSEAARLLSEIAHDIRSPLTSILFLSETLRAGRGQPIGPTQERQLMLIYSAAFELSALASDLTELGRGAGHLLETRPVVFHIADVLQCVRDTVRPIAEERGVEVRLPTLASAARVGHPAALERVMLNLVMNALRGTEHGVVEIEVQPRSRSRVEFAVRASGGIADAVIESIGEPLAAPWPVHRRGLSGALLGVEICRRLLASMQSDLHVRAEADRGSCLHFTLDLPPSTESEFGADTSPGRPGLRSDEERDVWRDGPSA